MGPTKKLLALFCVTIVLITTVTAGPLTQSERKRLIDAIIEDYQLQDNGRDALIDEDYHLQDDGRKSQ